MEGIDTVEDHAGGTGAREGGRDLVADVSGLADAYDHDFAAFPQRFDDEFNRLAKGVVELLTHRFDRGQFNIKNFLCFCEMPHGRGACYQSPAISIRKNEDLTPDRFSILDFSSSVRSTAADGRFSIRAVGGGKKFCLYVA